MLRKPAAILIAVALLAGAGAGPASAAQRFVPPGMGPDGKLLHGGRPTHHVGFPRVENWGSLLFKLERTRCFGGCPAYTVEIHGDGAVLYNGLSDVGALGHRSGRVSQADLRRLLDAFRKAQFFWLLDAYHAPITDLPSYKLSLAFDGRSKTVVDYAGTAIGMPQGVVGLEQLIDQIADTAQWVSKPAR